MQNAKCKVIFIIALLTFSFALFTYVHPALAQTGCITTGTAIGTGLLSTPSLAGQFVTSSGACIIDPKAASAPYAIPTFDSLKSLYYTQAKQTGSVTKHTLNGNKTQDDIPIQTGTNHLYYISGNLDITSFVPSPSASSSCSYSAAHPTGIIFVGGDLNIGPIPSNQLVFGDDNSGLVFIVKGKVNIDKSITQLDTVIIAEGANFPFSICTASENNNCPTTSVLASQLIVNGSLLALNKDAPIRFSRSLNDNTQAAEKINHQIKFLILLRNLMSDTILRWSEIDASVPVPAALPATSSNPVIAPPPFAENNPPGDLSPSITTCPSPDHTECHGNVYGYNGIDCNPNALICASNAASFENRSSQCGPDNRNACYPNNTRRTYYTGTSTGPTCNQATCGFPYSSSGNHDAVCGASWTGTIEAGTPNAVTGTWDQPRACQNPTTLKNYYTGGECTPSGTCNWPKPIDCADYANMCHGDINGYNGLDDGTGCIYNRKTCPSNVNTYANQARICGTNPQTGAIDNHNACIDRNNNHRRTYFTGDTNGASCTTARCSFPYFPNGNEAQVCGANAANVVDNHTACQSATRQNATFTALKTYYPGNSCSPVSCRDFPPATVCPTDSCHGRITGFNGDDCRNDHFICEDNYTTYPNHPAIGTSVCGADNINGCSDSNGDGVADSQRTYASGASCLTGDGTCPFPYSPGGNHDAVCGASWTGTIEAGTPNAVTGTWDTNSACATNSTTLNTYYKGDECNPSGVCRYPKPIDCTDYANMCHGNITGYNGLDNDGTGCIPNRKTCLSNASTYGDTAATSPSTGQKMTCGTNSSGTVDNHLSCTSPNPNGLGFDDFSRRQYYTGASSAENCTFTSCGFPAATCTTGSSDCPASSSTANCHGADSASYRCYGGNSCAKTGYCPATYLTQNGCTADGCSDPAGGTRDTGVLADSCSTYNCSLNSTYDKQCRVGGVATGALICTPSTQTPPAYHTNSSCGAVSCENNYINGGNAEACTADGCSDPAGGTRDTGVLANSCSTYNCPLTLTYNQQCRVGGVATGALICTPSTQTPPTYHTGSTDTGGGSCTTVTCGYNYLSVSNTPPACRDSAYPYTDSNSCTYDTISYPQNCFTRCNPAGTGCLYRSTIIVGGPTPAGGTYRYTVDAFWRDWYRNPSTLAAAGYIDSSHWGITVAVTQFRFDNWTGTECDSGYGYYYDDYNVNGSIHTQRNKDGINRPPRVTCPGPVEWEQSCGNEHHVAADSCVAGFSKTVYH